MRSLEEMDAELAALDENLRRLRERGVAELLKLAEAEPNWYAREFLLSQAEKVRLIGAEFLDPPASRSA
jgi:hypothetical protein